MVKKFEIQKQGFPSVADAYNGLLGMDNNRVVNLPISQLDEIDNQPFPINESKVDQIADSIENVGVIEPVIVVKNGERYSILSGRHRFRACQKLGKDEIPCYIKETDDTTARYILIATNTDRNNEYSPIVYARAYAEQIELMKKLGKKSVVNAIAEQNGINRKQIYRYLRLNYLIPELQKWVEDRILTIEAAVELSFLSGNKQLILFNYINTLGIADSIITRHFKVAKTKEIHNAAENVNDDEFAAKINNIIFGLSDVTKVQTEPPIIEEQEKQFAIEADAEAEYQEQEEAVEVSENEEKEKMGLQAPKSPDKEKLNTKVAVPAIKFKDADHEQNYKTIISMMKLTYTDTERIALAYLFALDEICFRHIHDLYDFANRCIVPEGLYKAWQTGTSCRTTRLAFNLFNGWCTDGEKYIGDDGFQEYLPSKYFSPVNLFCCSYALYYIEAIKLRFPEYFV